MTKEEDKSKDFDNNQDTVLKRRYIGFNSVTLIGVVEQVKIFMTQNNERLIRLNLKVPVDFNDPTKGPYNWFYVSCFGYNKAVKIGDWMLVHNGRLSKYKSVREGITRYIHQITSGESNLLNLTDLAEIEIPLNRNEDINDILDDIRSKFEDDTV